MVERFLNNLKIEDLTTKVVEYLPQVFAAVLIFFAFLLFYRIARKPLRLALDKAGLHARIVSLLVDSLLRWTLTILGAVMALDQLGVNIAAALAGLGVAGVALGFAAQDTVANVISGIVIFLDKPFQVGDWVEAEDEFGKVTHITLRTTRIRTPRNTFVVIPNKKIIDAVLENYSKHGELRIDVPVGIAYKEDIDAAREAILPAVRKIEAVLDEPAADVIVCELGDSSINLKVRVWIHDADDTQGTTWAVVEAAKKALDAAGIQIPFPHLQLFVDNVEDRVWEGARKLRAAGPGDAA